MELMHEVSIGGTVFSSMKMNRIYVSNMFRFVRYDDKKNMPHMRNKQ